MRGESMIDALIKGQIPLPRNDVEAANFERALNSGALPQAESLAPSEIAAPSAETPREGSVLVPDLDEAEWFLGILDPKLVYTFQTFADREDLKKTFIGRDGKQKKWDHLASVFHGTFREHAVELIARNQLGAGVFVIVNQGDGVIHAGHKTCRTKDNVIRVRALFVDLDGSPLDPVLEWPRRAHLIVESSPGRWHAYWRVQRCPLESFAPAQKALAEKFKGDISVNDLPRVMRVPGFIHHKGTPFMTRLIRPTIAGGGK